MEGVKIIIKFISQITLGALVATIIICLIKWGISLFTSIEQPSIKFILITFIVCFVIYLIFIVGIGLIRNKRTNIPDTLFERINKASLDIYQTFADSNQITAKCDDYQYIWEANCYIIATLFETNILSSDMCNKITFALVDKYARTFDYETSTLFVDWIHSGITFYNDIIYDYLHKSHTLPDAIVYNLLHPSIHRKYYDELPMLNIDFFQITQNWAIIGEIMGNYFFRNSEDISQIPLGC